MNKHQLFTPKTTWEIPNLPKTIILKLGILNLKHTTYLLAWLCCLLLFSNCDSSDPIIADPSMEEEETPTTPITPITPVTQQSTIAFYNVENLFDTEDDPTNPRDNEFLPNADKKWTMQRYNKKLENIGKVIQGLNFPILLGVAEVENQQVLSDLTAIEALKEYPYQIVHEESPDHRGIDVGLLYQADQFSVQDWQTYTVQIDDPNIANYTTRDILLVSGDLRQNPIHILVNHWPSRSGGTAQSEFRRITVATRLEAIIEELQKQSPTTPILLMGDFNDEPTNQSIAKILAAQPLVGTREASSLYNCTSQLDEQGEGSYNYQGKWQMLDQIIATGNLLDTDRAFFLQDFQVYKAADLLFTHPEYGLSPDRTYGGNQYYGGYSDHLPVYMTIGE